ncbi:MAG: glycosyltransferase family 2 protein [Candidatus Eiseniibacteriota bacterium]
MALYFSVIVPVWNGGTAFRACLAALSRSTFRDWELIVVDDGSTDGSDALAEQAGAQLLRTNGRVGPGAARNQGAAQARGEFVFFVDADCEVAPETLERAAKALRADPGLDALFGSYDDAPVARTLISQYKNLQHHFVHQHGSPEAATFWSGCGVMRRTRFLELGGFDVARYPRPSIEDIELGYRLRRAGGRIRLDKDVQVKHHKKWTLRGLVQTDVFDRGIPWTLLTLERPEIIVPDLNLRWQGKASVAASVLLVLLLVASLLEPRTLAAAAAVGVLLLVLNLDFYRFFLRKRGLLFMLASVPLHWFYFAYCAVAYAMGQARFRLARRPSRPA